MVRLGQRALPYQARVQDEGEGEPPNQTSLFADSESWSDSEPEPETRKHERSRRGEYASHNPSHFTDRFSRSHRNETYADLDGSGDPRLTRKAGGQIFMRGDNPFTQSAAPKTRRPPPDGNPFNPQPSSQHPPPPPPYSSGWDGNPFGAAPMGPPPAQPFPLYTAPPPWNGVPAGQYVHTAPPPRPPPTSYAQPPPNHYPTDPPPPTTYYDNEDQYYDNPMLSRSQQTPRSGPASARKAKARPRASTTSSSHLEYELEKVQKKLNDVLLDQEQERNRQEDVRRREQEAAAWEAARKRGIELLRESFKTEFNELRQELLLHDTEIQSEPARGPMRLDPRMRGYSDSATDWSPSGGRGGGNTDLLRQEIAKMVEAKRRHELRSRLGSVLGGQGDGYRNRVESERRSMAGSQVGSEYLRSEIEAVLIDTLRDISPSEPGDYRMPPRPAMQRPASDGYARSWHHGPSRSQTAAPPEYPFFGQTPAGREGFDINVYPGSGMPPPEQNTEAQWAGRPPRSTGRAQARRAARRDQNGQSQDTSAPEQGNASVPSTRVDPRGGHPDGGRRGSTYQEMGGNGRTAPGFPANQARTRSQHDPGNQRTYPEEYPGHGDEYWSDLESEGVEELRKREPAYPTVPAGHPYLREDFTPPSVPEPEPYLRQAGYKTR